MKRRIVWLWLLMFLPVSSAFSSASLFLEEPFGTFGFLNPTGHAAIYLSDVCAASPTRLRTCRPDEFGVVISRYHHIGGYDWLAIPLVPYLYSVDSVAQIPKSATPRTEAALRDAWRRKHLKALAPDAPGGVPPPGEWTQLIGALYDRKIFAYEFDTSEQQDSEFIQRFNSRPNQSHFNLFFNNCADFSRTAIDFYYPHSVRRSFSADLGMTTPKQLAKSLVHYSARHERIGMGVFVLPQVPGSIRRSKHVDGVLEAVLFKKYVVPLALLHPYFAAGIAVTYLTGGRFDPAKHAVTLDQADTVGSLRGNEPLSPNSADLAGLGITGDLAQHDGASGTFSLEVGSSP